MDDDHGRRFVDDYYRQRRGLHEHRRWRGLGDEDCCGGLRDQNGRLGRQRDVHLGHVLHLAYDNGRRRLCDDGLERPFEFGYNDRRGRAQEQQKYAPAWHLS